MKNADHHVARPLDRDAFEQAHRQAGLRGSLDEALANPTIATCLRNIVASNQANPKRWYDIATDGQTVFISNVRRRQPGVDIKRRASGDADEGGQA